MLNLKSKNFGKKLAAILLAAVAVTVPALSFGLTNKSYAETNLPPVGTKVAEKTEAWVIKDSTCVKRWHEYTISVYYEGTFSNVYTGINVHDTIYPTSETDMVLETENQKISKYSVTEITSESIEQNWHLSVGGKVATFLGNISGNITYDYKSKYNHEIIKSIEYTTIITTKATKNIHIDGVQNPFYHYYGDLLMLFKANKFKVVIKQQQHAKKRSSALSKWSDYIVEEQWEDSETFYAGYYGNDADYYRHMGYLGTPEEYEKLISYDDK